MEYIIKVSSSVLHQNISCQTTVSHDKGIKMIMQKQVLMLNKYIVKISRNIFFIEA